MTDWHKIWATDCCTTRSSRQHPGTAVDSEETPFYEYQKGQKKSNAFDNRGISSPVPGSFIPELAGSPGSRKDFNVADLGGLCAVSGGSNASSHTAVTFVPIHTPGRIGADESESHMISPDEALERLKRIERARMDAANARNTPAVDRIDRKKEQKLFEIMLEEQENIVASKVEEFSGKKTQLNDLIAQGRNANDTTVLKHRRELSILAKVLVAATQKRDALKRELSFQDSPALASRDKKQGVRFEERSDAGEADPRGSEGSPWTGAVISPSLTPSGTPLGTPRGDGGGKTEREQSGTPRERLQNGKQSPRFLPVRGPLKSPRERPRPEIRVKEKEYDYQMDFFLRKKAVFHGFCQEYMNTKDDATWENIEKTLTSMTPEQEESLIDSLPPLVRREIGKRRQSKGFTALSPRDGPAHSNVRHVVADALLAAREKDRIDHEMDALEEKERKKQITGREKDLGHKVLPRQVPAKT